MQRASFVPAGTPEAAVAALRTAWEALPRDGDFVSDYARVAKAPPHLVQAAAVQANVETMRRTAPETVAFIKEFIGGQ